MAETTKDRDPSPAPAPEPAAPTRPDDDAILEALEAGKSVAEALAPAPEVEPEPEAEEESPAVPKGELQGSSERREVAADDYEKALAALRRDGYPKSIVESLDEDVVVDLGLKRAKVQADYDRAYSKVSDLEKKLEELEAARKASPEPTTAEPVGDLGLDLAELLNPIEDLLGQDGKTAFEGLGKALQAQTSKALKAATGPLLEQIEAIQTAFYTLQEASARERLGTEFPELSDPDVYGRVRDRMGRMAAHGDYDDMATLMRDAAKIEFFDHRSPQTKEETQKRKDMKRNGTPSAADRRKLDVKAMSPDEREDAILEAIEAGDTETLAMLRRT